MSECVSGNLLSVGTGLSAVLGYAVDVLPEDDRDDDESAKEEVASVHKSLFFGTECH